MLAIAAGWLGWPESQAMSTDVNYILAAYKGRVLMLQALFGGSEEKTPPTSEQIKSFVKTHNALYRAGRLRGVGPKRR